jgi:Glycosyl hydrolases family 43
VRKLALLLALPILAVAPLAFAAPATIHPGTLGKDQHGNPLQLHGLGIVKVGSTWYGFGEDKVGENQNDTSFRAIPCYSSTNLATWTYVRESLIRQKSGDLGPHRIVERPKVLYNAATRKFVMYLHIDDPAYAQAKVGVATSPSVCGPYSYRGSFRPLGQQSRDIGLFQDSDPITGTGTGYLLTEDRAHGLRIDQLSADYLGVSRAVAVLGRFEAPAMTKVGGRYYLLGSHLTGWNTNDNEYTTATSPGGPWAAWQTFAPKGSRTFNSQTANIITVPGSRTTTLVYAGDRWTPNDLGNSPLVWLPLTVSGTRVSLAWHDSWSIDVSTGSWSA